MLRSEPTRKDETPRKFGDRTEGFEGDQKITHSSSVLPKSRAEHALRMLVCAGADGLTQAQALMEGNGWRLAASICTLRKLGFQIHTRRQHLPNGRWCARYELMGLAEGALQ